MKLGRVFFCMLANIDLLQFEGMSFFYVVSVAMFLNCKYITLEGGRGGAS
jgi:hypothetical protein